jgi:tol-pal system protein YbgF
MTFERGGQMAERKHTSIFSALRPLRSALPIALLLAACATTAQDDAVAPAPLPPPEDPRVGQLQTTLTELLERIDVLNSRIARLEEERAAPPPAAAPAPAPAPQVSRPSAPLVAAPAQGALANAKIADDYRKAIMSYGRGAYAEARQSFQGVLDSDPTGDLADNALFWIGETYFATRDYNNALRYYTRVTTDFADQNKAPDALYKTALVHEKTSDLALAKKTLQQVIERYPYSTSASMAKQELQRIKY